MRTARSLALLVVLTISASAKAQDATVEQASAPAPAVAAARSLPWLGVMADAGVPDGMQGSLVLRPFKWFRASVGGGYNMISKGVRGGISVLPFGRGPSATLEAGRYFEGDANATARKFMGPGFQDNAALERVGYDYANAHLGLDFGYKRVTFYIHGGMSYIQGKVHNLDQFVQTDPSINGQNSSGTQVSIPQPVTVTAIVPSAKLGLIVYLW
jgi:opacity protein-like surface antigen